MSKIVVVGANHAGTACINTMLDNFGNENESMVQKVSSTLTKKNWKQKVQKST